MQAARIRRWAAVVPAVILSCGLARGGPPSAATVAAPSREASHSTPAAHPTEPVGRRPGDVIVLKGGTVLDGMQIVRSSPKEFVLEIVGGVTLTVPRAQVDRVTRDNLTAADARKARSEARAESGELLPGLKLSTQFVNLFFQCGEGKNSVTGYMFSQREINSNIFYVVR